MWESTIYKSEFCVQETRCNTFKCKMAGGDAELEAQCDKILSLPWIDPPPPPFWSDYDWKLAFKHLLCSQKLEITKGLEPLIVEPQFAEKPSEVSNWRMDKSSVVGDVASSLYSLS